MSYAVYGYNSQQCYYKAPHATKADCMRFLDVHYRYFDNEQAIDGRRRHKLRDQLLPEPMRIVEQYEKPKPVLHVKRKKAVNKQWTDDEISVIRHNLSKSVLWLASKLPNRSYSAVEQKCYTIQKEMGIR